MYILNFINMELKILKSKDNQRIKQVQKLSLKKYRDQSGEFLVENWTTIRDGLKEGFGFESIFLTPEFKNQQPEAIKFLEERAGDRDVFLIEEKINKHLSQLDTPSGVLAVYKKKQSKPKEGESVIYLNGLSDPGNLGTILRTSLAFGFLNIVLDKDCVDFSNPKTISAAKDAIFKLRIYEDKKNVWLQDCGRPVYVTLPREGVSLEEFSPQKNYCLVLGSESRGVGPEIIKQAEQKISVPMPGKIESLNVAAGAAIILYQLSLKSFTRQDF